MMNISKISIITLLLTFVSCAGLHQKKEAKTTIASGQSEQKIKSIDDKESLENAKNHLDSLVKEAIKTGPEAVEYLSNDFFIKATDVSFQGDAYTAAIIFEALIKLNPEDIYLKRRYAVELIRIGKLDEAKAVVTTLYNNSKHSDETMGLVLAGIHTALNETKEAKKIYLTVLKKNPQSAEGCLFLTKIYTHEKKFKAARKKLLNCRRVIKDKNDKTTFSYYLAKLDYDQGKKKSAIKKFQKILKKNPDYSQAAMALGLIYEEMQHFSKAVVIYKKFVKDNPSSFQVLNRLVQIMFLEEMGEEIVPYAEKLVHLDPEDLNLKVRLGTLYYDFKEYDKAAAVFEEIIKAVPDSDRVLYYLGASFQQLDDVEKSIEYFSKINQTSSYFAEAHVQIGHMLSLVAISESEDPNATGSNEDKNKLLSFFSSNKGKSESLDFGLNIVMANYYEALKDIPKAIEYLEQAQKSKFFGVNQSYYYASLLEQVKRFDEAYALINDILKQDPKNSHALNFLGYSYLERGIKMNDAYKLISKAVKMNPESGYIRDSLGWYYFKIGKYRKALKEIKMAVKLTENDVEINKHLGMVYQQLKMYNEAKVYFEKALRNCRLQSEKEEVVEAIKNLEKLRLPASTKN